MGNPGPVIGDDDPEDDIVLPAGGAEEVSSCEMVGDSKAKGVVWGEKVRLGDR